MRLTVVTGAPCSGKSTHVEKHRQPGDVTIDLDRLAHTLGYPDQQLEWNTTHPAKHVALRARASAIKAIRNLDADGTAWIIDTVGTLASAATSVIDLDPGEAECHRRATADNRPDSTHAQIATWYGDPAARFFDDD